MAGQVELCYAGLSEDHGKVVVAREGGTQVADKGLEGGENLDGRSYFEAPAASHAPAALHTGSRREVHSNVRRPDADT
jgi:hypothetical protein